MKQHFFYKLNQGFTLIELLLVMGLTAVMLSLVTISLLRPQTKASADAAILELTSDLKQQQLKAMAGQKENNEAEHFGVYIEPHQYTLFQGSSYQANNSTNFQVNLGQNVTLSTTFAGSQVIFNHLSGEVQNFVNGANTITIQVTNGDTPTIITLNAYGVSI